MQPKDDDYGFACPGSGPTSSKPRTIVKLSLSGMWGLDLQSHSRFDQISFCQDCFKHDQLYLTTDVSFKKKDVWSLLCSLKVCLI